MKAGNRMYTLMALVALLIVFAGFARTFYLRGAFTASSLPGLLMAHGVVMTLWFGLFITQVRLVAGGRGDLHRRLGVAGAILAVLVVTLGTAAAIDAARRGASPAPQIPPLMFLAIPLADLVLFTLFVGTALRYRKRSDIHRRLMLLATLSMLTPAIARVLRAILSEAPAPAFFGVTLLLIFTCVVVDTVKNRRLHPAFGWGVALFVASIPLRIAVANTPGWTKFANWLIG